MNKTNPATFAAGFGMSFKNVQLVKAFVLQGFHETQCDLAAMHQVKTLGEVGDIDVVVWSCVEPSDTFSEAVVDFNRTVGFDAGNVETGLGGVGVERYRGRLFLADACTLEEGSQYDVAVHHNIAGIFYAFIAPLLEEIALVRNGLDGDAGTSFVESSSNDRTLT